MIVSQRDVSNARDFVKEYKSCTPQMGIRVNEPLFCAIPDDRIETFLKEIRAKMTDRVMRRSEIASLTFNKFPCYFSWKFAA